jgi:transposase
MEKEDARKQSREVLHERRKQVIRLYWKGMRVMQIVEHSGLSWYAVNAAIKVYLATGAGALKPAARDKKQGSDRMLSEAQESAVRRIICDKRPEPMKMEFALWNRAAVRQLIEREYAIALSVRGVGNYLKRWGFAPQKPIKKAYEQRPGPCRNGWTSNTPRLSGAPSPRVPRFTGATKRRS